MARVRPYGSFPIIEFDVVECKDPRFKSPCFVFKKYKDKNGYGWIGFNGKKYSVHRYVWELAMGNIPSGMMIDHQCRNTSCCNLFHLRVVTPRVNTVENSLSVAALHLKRDTCIAGHEWTPENTRIRSRVGGRDCRACARRRWAEMRERRRKAVAK